jgi:hypothetical protein
VQGDGNSYKFLQYEHRGGKGNRTTELGRPRIKLNVHESRTCMRANKTLLRFRRAKSCWKDEPVPLMVDFTQELGTWDRAITTERVRHPQTRLYRKDAI